MSDLTAKQSKREFAYLGRSAQQCYSERFSFYTVKSVVGYSSFCSAANSQYRYPSPDRPAYSPSRPITEIRLRTAKMTGDIGYHDEIAIHRSADCTNCGAIDITMIGLRLCKRHPSSLRQWQYSVWQVALKATWNVASRALQVASWPQKCWAQTQQARQLQVLPLACFAMTQALTPVNNSATGAQIGRTTYSGRRRGNSPAAVFSFLGT